MGILPVEVVVPDGAGLTLRCYVEDAARFLGADGEVYLFGTPAELSAFVQGDEEHDLADIASWPEVEATTVSPLPVDQDRYDLVEVAEVLAEVADGAAGWSTTPCWCRRSRACATSPSTPAWRGSRSCWVRAPAGPGGRPAERDPRAALRAEDAARLTGPWDELVREVSTALVFRD